ncbi:glycosyltransferase family 2 protein [Metallumcola ferriviriculae]|uniref:Glucosyl-3-phosphoglycerate synthase n=1 Tax=Metallumcola ferriviriculae TaxID=3039180 RepID=A0AAU0UR59_9FIRM|nr:glycosyltransferase family 2 protein [Desulfitibacteraceae bacterium MK1]
MKDDVSVIIPAYNEAAVITATLNSLNSLPHIKEIVVVDDGSNDGTAEKAKAAGAQVIVQPFNKGKGAALTRGLQESLGEYICFLDADLGESAACAAKLYQPIKVGNADIAIAAFPPAKSKGGFGVVTNLARFGLRSFTGKEFQSPLSGQRAMSRGAAERLAPFADGFGVEVSFTIDAYRAGFRVIEIPVEMFHRETGRDWRGFYHRGRQCCHVARVFLEKARDRGRGFD